MYGILLPLGMARFREVMMVFCRECQKKVEDCAHFMPPLDVKAIDVFDPKVKTVAYDAPRKILELTFKNGQIWQLREVPQDIYQELLHQTMSSFLKFIAHRYKANPVRRKSIPIVPESEPCPACKRPMVVLHRTRGGLLVRVLWHCSPCNQSGWRAYGNMPARERRTW